MDLNANASDSFVDAIGRGAEEAASAFSRTFDASVTFSAGQAGVLDAAHLKANFSVPGLAMTLLTEGKTILVLVPSTTGLIPDWCKDPDATGKSKLSTFAQELGMNVVPDDFFPEDFVSAVVPDLAAAAERGKIGPEPGYAELVIDRNGEKTVSIILWPIEDREAVFQFSQGGDSGAAPSDSKSAGAASSPLSAEPPVFAGTPSAFGAGDFAGGFPAFGGGSEDFENELEQKPLSLDELPGYSRSVLKIRVPVAVVLARMRKPIKSILELGVGSIIQFDKSCDEPLELEIDRTIVALGDAVKVGDKFGIRLSAVLLPKERFRTVEVRRGGEYKARAGRPPQVIGKAPIKSLEIQ